MVRVLLGQRPFISRDREKTTSTLVCNQLSLLLWKVEENCAEVFTVENKNIPLFDLIKFLQMNLKRTP